MSQRAFAQHVGVPQATVSRWENGQLDSCFESLNKAAEGLGITCCELVGCQP